MRPTLPACCADKHGQFQLFVKEFLVSMQVKSGEEWELKKGFGFYPSMYCRKRWSITDSNHMTPGFHSLFRVCSWVCHPIIILLSSCHRYKTIPCRFHRCPNFSSVACNCVSRKGHNLASWHGILFWNIYMVRILRIANFLQSGLAASDDIFVHHNNHLSRYWPLCRCILYTYWAGVLGCLKGVL